MTHDDQDLLDLLTFELKFLEDGGYGRAEDDEKENCRDLHDLYVGIGDAT